jgi:DNA polymerase I-like protein with 3'-5' exonuclease and polymerase domains
MGLNMARKKKEEDVSPPEPVTKNYDYSTDTGEISPEELIEAAKRAGIFIYDLETTGLNLRAGRIEGISFYIPVRGKQDKEIRAWFPFTENTMVYTVGKEVISLRPAMDPLTTMERLRPIWLLEGVIKGTANGKFDDAGLGGDNSGASRPILVVWPKADSMLADYVADERHRRYGLKTRYEQVFNERMTTYEEASQRQGQFSFMNPKPLGVYAMDDAKCTYRLLMWAIEQMLQQDPPRLRKPGEEWASPLKTTDNPLLYSSLEKIFWEIEMKLRDVVMEMETTGCLIDWEHLVELEGRLEEKKSAIVKEIVDKAGWAPNLRSPKQVSDFLFNDPEEGGLGLPTDGLEQGTEGDYSTSEKVIKHFGRKNDLVKKLLSYRSLEVIDRSFCKKLIKIAQEEGRVYTGFHQTGTKTGRLSSSKPINLMNQPRSKEYSIRKSFCAKLPHDTSSDLVILDVDYGQLELRLIAHTARDPSLLEVYNSGGVCKCDRFLQGYECENPDRKVNCKWEGLITPDQEKKCPKCGSTAIKWQERCRHVDVHQRTSEDVGVPRNPLSKNLNFGCAYRIGAPKFVATADLYDEEGNPKIQFARDIIDKWMDTYWRIPAWHSEVEDQLRVDRWIAYSGTGRRRRLDEEKKFNEYGAVTQAINFQIQGLGADLIKIGMIRVYNERAKRIANSAPEARKQWERLKFLIQVHDECLWECPKAIEPEAMVMIKTIMEGVHPKLRCPLVFSLRSGANWAVAH